MSRETRKEPKISSEWLLWDEQYVWHPYTQMQLLPRAVGVQSARGSYLYLEDGRRILDAISSWWVTLHGHAHPTVAKKIAEQAATLEQVIFAGFTHEPASKLAKELVEITPKGLDKVFFSDNGSTAVEVALKMCVQYWKHQGEDRTIFLALDHAYHGDTFGSMSVSAPSAFTKPFDELLFSVERLTFPQPSENNNLSTSEERFLSELEEKCSSHSIAAFIYEPLLLGAGGMLMWRKEVLQQALVTAKKYGVLTIADEVLTGFGRTGKMFASEYADISPDLMTLSKGLTGGFLPMGVTMVTSSIFRAFLDTDRTKTFFHGHSYTGNPLSCAAALASLSVFKEESVDARIETIISTHDKYGRSFAAKHNYEFRQIGTVAAFEPKNSIGYLSNQSLTFGKKALEMGVLIRPLGDVLYLLPPYSTTENDLAVAYDVMGQLLALS